MIPEEAVVAARRAGLYEQYGAGMVTDQDIRAALEAAAPYMTQAAHVCGLPRCLPRDYRDAP